MNLPYTNQTTGDIADIRTSREILQDLDVLVKDLRKEVGGNRAKIDRKVRFAAYGAVVLGAIALFMPDEYQDSVEAWMTYASFGVALGVLLG